MNNVIIGTAGHVDHGKTLLIKALTGIETDRLKEEKKRGITIELGFAYMPLPNGELAGIVDVPGHEKFVKNMLAGAGGMDVVLLVVAADEGFMPQTREHLGILSLLDLKEGIVVLTKTDLVDEEWLEVVKEEVAAEIKGTFLEQAPILPVSAVTGQGLDELKSAIYGAIDRSQGKNTRAPARIPIDRVFTMEGFGTVITGTLLEGSVSEGDELMLYPSETLVRVRGVQVHSRSVQTAYAGQRTAINLAGVKKTDIQKGDTLARPGSLDISHMLDVRLSVVRDTERRIETGSQLHFYHGTRDLLCKLVLLEQDALTAGQTGYAQLRFSEPVATRKGDHFVVRFYSPVETVGGGVILDSLPARHRRRDPAVIEGLQVKESGSGTDLLAQKLLELSPSLTPIEDIAKQAGVDSAQLDAALDEICGQGLAVRLTEKYTLHTAFLQDAFQKLEKTLREYHSAQPLQSGIRRDELRGKFVTTRDLALIDALLARYASEGLIREEQGRVALASFTVTYTPAQQKLLEELTALYEQAGVAPPDTDEVLASHPREKDLCRQVLDAMVTNGTLVAIAPQILMHTVAYESALAALRAHFEGESELALSQFRDSLGTSRKYALALLEYWDRQGITRKVGETRVLTGK